MSDDIITRRTFNGLPVDTAVSGTPIPTGCDTPASAEPAIELGEAEFGSSMDSLDLFPPRIEPEPAGFALATGG